MKLYILAENGTEMDNRGVSIVEGPDDSDLKKLHEEFRNIDYSDKPDEVHVVETWETKAFTTWLIKNKNFKRPKANVFYVDDWEVEEKINRYKALRENPKTSKSYEEAMEKIEKIKKDMKNPSVLRADDPSMLTLGWIVQDGQIEETVQCVQLPLEFSKKR